MQGWYLVPLCQLLITALAEPVRDDEIKFLIFMLCTFKAEIEIAARDSALLAEELADMLERLENDNDSDQETISVISTELDKAIDTTEKLSKESLRKKSKGNKKLSRKPKQQDDDFDFGFVDSLLDALNLDDAEFDENFDESGKREPKTSDLKSSQQQKEATKEKTPKSEEKCEDKVAENKVQVCAPDYEVKPQRLYFKAQETYDEKYCYTKTNTECEIKTSPVSRRVCTFKYLQKDHNVPATNVEVSFEKHSEKMGVTNCKHIKNEYGEMTEICNIEYISIHYKLPVVAEEVLEFIDVKYPEPEEECIDVDFEEVYVDCDHDEDNYCVNCAHIRDSKVDLVADQIYPSRYGQCDENTLKLPQSLCVVEQHIKQTIPQQKQGYRQSPRHYRQSGAFTAFQ